MTNRGGTSPARAGGEEAVGDRLGPQLTMMYRAFMASAERTKLLMLFAAVITVLDLLRLRRRSV